MGFLYRVVLAVYAIISATTPIGNLTLDILVDDKTRILYLNFCSVSYLLTYQRGYKRTLIISSCFYHYVSWLAQRIKTILSYRMLLAIYLFLIIILYLVFFKKKQKAGLLLLNLTPFPVKADALF
jgi:hypothetical protein